LLLLLSLLRLRSLALMLKARPPVLFPMVTTKVLKPNFVLVTVFGEIGPGYEWTKGKTTTTGETVAVGEVGVKVKAAKNVSVNAKVTGEYGNTTEVFDMGGELKVRYSF
jgi:hypothetical protein